MKGVKKHLRTHAVLGETLSYRLRFVFANPLLCLQMPDQGGQEARFSFFSAMAGGQLEGGARRKELQLAGVRCLACSWKAGLEEKSCSWQGYFLRGLQPLLVVRPDTWVENLEYGIPVRVDSPLGEARILRASPVPFTKTT